MAMYCIYGMYSTVYHGLYRLGVYAAAPAMKTNASYYFCIFVLCGKISTIYCTCNRKIFLKPQKVWKTKDAVSVSSNFSV